MVDKKKTKINIFKTLVIVIIILLLSCLSVICWQIYVIKRQMLTLQQTNIEISQQQDTIQKLQAKIHDIVNINGYNKTSWTLPEGKYLLHLANINLIANNNIDMAVKLLQLADKRIAALRDPALTDVRRAFANDISALQAVPQVDITGIILRIDAISTQIEHLSLIPKFSKVTTATQPTTPSDQNKSFWQRFDKTSLEKLHDIVIIRHHDTAITPILTDTQQIYLLQNIKLALEQAKWALLHKNENVYQNSLQRAINLINFGFEHNLNAAKSILDSLQNLQKIDIKPPTPNIMNSITALAKIQSGSSS